MDYININNIICSIKRGRKRPLFFVIYTLEFTYKYYIKYLGGIYGYNY